VKRAYDYIATYGLLAILTVIIIVWTTLALILLPPLPRRWRRATARYTIMAALRLFTGMLSATGAYELDLAAIDAVRRGPALILAPNHPASIDALLFLARHPDLTCILKPELMSNFFFGAAARLAGFVRSHPPRRMVREAVAELRRGAPILLFPEGTRTIRAPINPLTGSAGVIARHAGVAIQVVLIETDSPYLGKGWPFFRVPRLPIRYRVRLGRQIEPNDDAAACRAALERELTRELAGAPQNGWLSAAPGGKALLDGR
jgi:1-acyl-sn-glycerol-3-phosphate acyltransferase